MDRTVVRWGLVVLAVGVVAALAALPAGANLRGCIGCIEASDVARSAIRSKHIADGAVTLADLAPGAGGAVGVLELTGTTTSTSASSLASFLVDPPGPGTVLVTVQGVANIVSSGPGSATAIAAELALCDEAGSFEDCGDTHVVLRSDEPDNLAGNTTQIGFSLVRAIPVTGPARTFYVNGLRTAPAASVSLGAENADNGGLTFASAVFASDPLPIEPVEPEESPSPSPS